MKTFRLLTALLLTGLFLATAQADDSAQDRAWKQSAVIYLLAPTIRGTSGIGPVDGDVDIEALKVDRTLDLSTPAEIRLGLLWLALLPPILISLGGLFLALFKPSTFKKLLRLLNRPNQPAKKRRPSPPKLGDVDELRFALLASTRKAAKHGRTLSYEIRPFLFLAWLSWVPGICGIYEMAQGLSKATV